MQFQSDHTNCFLNAYNLKGIITNAATRWIKYGRVGWKGTLGRGK